MPPGTPPISLPISFSVHQTHPSGKVLNSPCLLKGVYFDKPDQKDKLRLFLAEKYTTEIILHLSWVVDVLLDAVLVYLILLRITLVFSARVDGLHPPGTYSCSEYQINGMAGRAQSWQEAVIRRLQKFLTNDSTLLILSRYFSELERKVEYF